MPTDTPPNPPRQGLQWGRAPQTTFRVGPLPTAVNRLAVPSSRRAKPVATAEPPASARIAEQLSMPMPEPQPQPQPSVQAPPRPDPAGLVAKPAATPSALPGGGI